MTNNKYLKSFYNLHLRKESLAHDRLDVLMHENSILSEVRALKYTVLKKYIRASTAFKCIFL